MPDEVLAALHAAEADLLTAPRPSPVHGAAAEWAEVVAAAQRVANIAVAVQDEALVSLAAIEPELLDDGTVVETHRAPGHVALDAPAIVSGALSVSAVHAESRVRAAVRLAADGPAGSSTATGLRALHEAMGSGRLDSYRAGVLADELEEAPPQVAAAVVHALEGYFDHGTGPQLRGRCRKVLATISPDLVRRRATRAREQCGLRRFAREPGVDQWEGTFPSEDAARAWAAIDARAQQLRADGTCPRIERARAQALIDLVTGSATITTVLTLTVPAAAAAAGAGAGAGAAGNDDAAPTDSTADAAPAGTLDDTTADAVPAAAPDSPTGHPNQAGALADSTATDGADASRAAEDASSVASADDLVEVTVSGIAQPVLVTRGFLDIVGRAVESQTVTTACHPVTGALLGSTGSSAYRPPAAVVALVKQRDGRCRFPGCHVNARFCDLDHVRPWPSGPTTASNLICLCRRHHRIKQRLGWTVRLAVDATCTWTDPTGRVRTTSAVDALHTMVLPAPGCHSDSNEQPDLADQVSAAIDPTARPDETLACGQSAQLGHTAEAGIDEPDSGGDSRTRYDLLGTMSERHSGLEFTLEHHAAASTTTDLTRAVALRSASVQATGHPSRIAVDVHHPHAHRPRADRFVLAMTWPHAPGHRTSRPCRGSDGRGESDDPPF